MMADIEHISLQLESFVRSADSGTSLIPGTQSRILANSGYVPGNGPGCVPGIGAENDDVLGINVKKIEGQAN